MRFPLVELQTQRRRMTLVFDVSSHLQTGGRVGSKSPSSIPISPTSVNSHSSSSAIFERDIESLVSTSPLIHPRHLIPRLRLINISLEY
ncbi:hypothetical protein VKT23_010034 [Stygiomarasmius scandens]|uniref:Uncharacterized protein n=1 Tax=Marasmiellus scandens TaxID=2682957 RepID=A0ABR1JIQ0_9AGAR